MNDYMQKKLSQLLKKMFGPTSSKEFDHNDNLEICKQLIITKDSSEIACLLFLNYKSKTFQFLGKFCDKPHNID